MKKNIWTVAPLAVILVGCNVGNAPEPMSESQLKDAVSNLPPKDAVNYINASPMPAAEKARRIAEIEAKTGYKAPASNAPKTGP
jgi:hypothetical protein